MNTKRKLVMLSIAAVLSACAAPQEKPSVTEVKQPVVEAAKAPAEAPAPKPTADSGDGVVILPLDQPEAPPPANVAAPAAEAMPPAEMKMTEAAPSPSAEPSAPAVETAPVSTVLPHPAPAASMAKATPPKATTVVADNVPREFTITVETKNPSHPNYGRGHEIGFVVDGTQGKELVLTRGVTYVFHVRTNVQHDFYFTTSPRGRGAGTVTDGITGQFTYNGDVTFTPTATTPDVMYYECRNHPFMGGKINIANAGDKVTVGGETLAAPESSEVKQVVSAAQVKQKLNFADMMITSSPPAKRVAASANADAKKLYAQAKQRLDSAHSALSAGDNAAAMQAVNESLRLMSDAGRLVPSETGEDYKAHYGELTDQMQGFEKSYQKNLARGLKPKSGKELDQAEYDRLVKTAKVFAAQDQYQDAVKLMENASDMLTEALGALLESQTVVYDKNFATPKEEYEYELSRYDSYEELIPLAIEQRQPLEQTVKMMHDLAARAKDVRDQGVALAAKGDHKQAILALQAATERLQQALRLAGVQ
jgi:tetratricopeptide (TPR) repeat protein